jgi:hypothetical protein
MNSIFLFSHNRAFSFNFISAVSLKYNSVSEASTEGRFLLPWSCMSGCCNLSTLFKICLVNPECPRSFETFSCHEEISTLFSASLHLPHDNISLLIIAHPPFHQVNYLCVNAIPGVTIQWSRIFCLSSIFFFFF